MDRFTRALNRLAGPCLAFAAAAVLLAAGAVPAAAVTCAVEPSRVDIGLSYHGSRLAVSGETGPAEDLIVRIMSPFEESHLKYLDKAAGLFWMKKGTMTFKSTPSVYMIFSTKDLPEILDRGEQDRNLLGYEALAGQAQIESGGMEVDGEKWFREFFRFKEKERLYTVRGGAVSRTGAGEYLLEADWPFQAPPGDYTVEVFAVTDGRVTEKSGCTLTVARKGLVAWFSRLAFERAPVYGIMAIIIAMASGIAVGAVFKGGGGGH